MYILHHKLRAGPRGECKLYIISSGQALEVNVHYKLRGRTYRSIDIGSGQALEVNVHY